MNAWIEHKARRLIIVGALAFAVGAPTVACMGGGDDVASDDDDAGDDDDDKADGFDAAEAIKGTWQVRPHADDMRELKIIDMAMRPKGNKEMLKKRLKPPPTADDLKLFDEIRKMPKDSPDIQFLKSMIKMMKDARLVIDDSTYVLTIADDSQTMQYTMSDKGEDSCKVSIKNGPGGDEEHELTFDGDKIINVKITSPRPQNLVFARK